LIGGGLLIRSLVNLQRVQLGFASHGLITFQLDPPPSEYPGIGSAPHLYRQVLDSLRSIPGVSGASVSSGIPFGAGNYTTHPMFTTGPAILRPAALVPVDWRIVSPGYFKVMNIPLLRGRDFTDADDNKAPHVLIVSQATVKTFWGDADPIGRTLRRSADPNTPFTVVGVVGNVRDTALNQESLELYYPMAARVTALMDIVVRTNQAPSRRFRRSIIKLPRSTSSALANIRTMDEWVSSSAAQPRMNTVLLFIFSSIALVIASIGIYGVLAYSVSQRTSEIGLRMALGASRGDIFRLVATEGVRMALTGLGVGLVAAVVAGKAISSLIYGVSVGILPPTPGGGVVADCFSGSLYLPGIARRETCSHIGVAERMIFGLPANWGCDQMAENFRGWISLELFSRDLRQACRQLYRTPVLTATVVLVLAVGLGVSVATFSIVRNVLLSPLPYNQPDRLVQIVSYWPKAADHNDWTAPLLDAMDWKTSVPAFQGVAMYRYTLVNLTGSGEPESLYGLRVTANLLPMLVKRPQLGN
jgi:hypothetical protein